MDRKKTRNRAHPPLPSGVHSPRVHVHLYSLLLIATPFLMLRSYMQDAVGRLSASTFALGGMQVPRVPLVVGVLLLVVLVLVRRRLTRRLLAAGVVGLGMFLLGQRLTDYYFGHRFYELQQNWHYIAYSLFALMVHRDLAPRGVPVARRMLITFGLALAYSTADEIIQSFISSRVFDTSDIAKDCWGVFTGVTILLVATGPAEFGRTAWRKIRQPSLGRYFRHVPSLWILQLAFGLLFLFYSSLLTDAQYTGTVFGLVAGTFLAAFLLLHASQYRLGGRALLAAAAIGVVFLGVSFARHHGEVRSRFGLTTYSGVPLPFVDILILPDGQFRLVDKKHFFNTRDRAFLDRQKADIILIGAGHRLEGGKGFQHTRGSRFTYNTYTERGSQVIILPTPEACARYELLKKAGKRVLIVIHSTC